VLNRCSAWNKTIAAVITQKNQYVGYKSNNVVTDDYRKMADMMIDDWEANGKQTIAGCNRFYFSSGDRRIPYNKFSVCEDGKGSWYDRQETPEGTFCRHAHVQAEQFSRHSLADANNNANDEELQPVSQVAMR
jgi:hypothetical protein